MPSVCSSALRSTCSSFSYYLEPQWISLFILILRKEMDAISFKWVMKWTLASPLALYPLTLFHFPLYLVHFTCLFVCLPTPKNREGLTWDIPWMFGKWINDVSRVPRPLGSSLILSTRDSCVRALKCICHSYIASGTPSINHEFLLNLSTKQATSLYRHGAMKN